MKIPFTKMHGCGNDYIYVNCFSGIPFDPHALSKAMSPRHFSIGSDGLVLICKSKGADFKMRMFNLDGSEGKMCGNAIRCVGKYVYDNHLTDKRELSIETLSGIKYLKLNLDDKGKVSTAIVNMGKYELEPKKIPVITPKKEFINEPVTINNTLYHMTAVSMGNPHAVIFLDDISCLKLDDIGPSFENNPLFPERVNTEFVKVMDSNHLDMRVYERGSGETWACGTGACASAVSSILNGYSHYEEPIAVHLRGGTLTIIVKKDHTVMMEGNTVKVYEGEYEYEDQAQ